MGAAGGLPPEPIVCLDELESEQARLRPLDLATQTVVETFADTAATRCVARAGHERAYMRALLALLRRRHRYEVHELRDFACVALVREVPECPLSSGEADEQLAAGGGGGGVGGGGSGSGTAAAAAACGSGTAAVDTSRAEASANVEGGGGFGGKATEPEQPWGRAEHAEGSGGGARSTGGVVPGRLRAALEVEAGSLEALLGLGVPRLEADLLVHVRPNRLEVQRQLKDELEDILQRYMQAHGPLLHLHFLATLPTAQGAGLGADMLQHLERMADTEGRHLYLEANSQESRRLYSRHGFRDVQTFLLGGEGGVPLYIMARPPGAKPAAQVQPSQELGGAAEGAAAEGAAAEGAAAEGAVQAKQAAGPPPSQAAAQEP